MADFLATWAVQGRDTEGLVLDPTCGDRVFLLAAARRLAQFPSAGSSPLLYGIDVQAESLNETRRLLEVDRDHQSRLLRGDFFDERAPG
jgi:hypothetical protein